METEFVSPDYLAGRLKPLPTALPPEWRLWQYQSLNLHRGVIHWDATAATLTRDALRDQVRAVVRDHFRPSWWRGFGFGVVASFDASDPSLRNAADLVDVRNNSKGVWQWLVLHCPKARAAVGICTWTEGYLAPVYRDLLAQLEDAGYDCESHQKDMDAFIAALVKLQEQLRHIKRTLGGLEGLGGG